MPDDVRGDGASLAAEPRGDAPADDLFADAREVAPDAVDGGGTAAGAAPGRGGAAVPGGAYASRGGAALAAAPIPSRSAADPRAPGRRDGLVEKLAGVGRVLVGVAAAVALWAAAVWWFAPPRYVFPAPADVLDAFVAQPAYLLRNAGVTAGEIAVGLIAGVLAGVVVALAIASAPLARRLLLPAVVATQALPVFAIAPLLVVWLGYGMASKVAMAGLIIFFPVATAYAEAMARVDEGFLDLARLGRARPWQTLFFVRAPAGLPGLVAGLKVAASVAPIGAVVGEWVGASAGLGFVMVQANARSQTPTMFAALLLLAVLALALRAAVDRLADRLVPWQPTR